MVKLGVAVGPTIRVGDQKIRLYSYLAVNLEKKTLCNQPKFSTVIHPVIYPSVKLTALSTDVGLWHALDFTVLHEHPRFICEWNEVRQVLLYHFLAETGPHLPTPAGWKAELDLRDIASGWTK